AGKPGVQHAKTYSGGPGEVELGDRRTPRCRQNPRPARQHAPQPDEEIGYCAGGASRRAVTDLVVRCRICDGGWSTMPPAHSCQNQEAQFSTVTPEIAKKSESFETITQFGRVRAMAAICISICW